MLSTVELWSYVSGIYSALFNLIPSYKVLVRKVAPIINKKRIKKSGDCSLQFWWKG